MAYTIDYLLSKRFAYSRSCLNDTATIHFFNIKLYWLDLYKNNQSGLFNKFI